MISEVSRALLLGVLCLVAGSASAATPCKSKDNAQKSLLETCNAVVIAELVATDRRLDRDRVSKWCGCVVVTLDWAKAVDQECKAKVSGFDILEYSQKAEMVARCGSYN